MYSVASALILVYLSRKRVHLSQYEPLRDSDEQQDDDEDNEAEEVEEANQTNPSATTTTLPSIDVLQAQYQAQQNAGISISIARLSLTFTQLGLVVYSTVFTTTLLLNNNSNSNNDAQYRYITRSITSFGLEENVQILSWTYILILTLVHLIRPKVSYQYWIRPQMDLFYFLQWILSTVGIVLTKEIQEVPVNQWSLGLRLTVVAWLANLALLWTTLVTRPYQPLPSSSEYAAKKLKAGEITRLPSSEYNSSLYARLTYTWVNSLVYLGFKRTLQDNDLPNLEDSDRADHSIRIYGAQT